MRRPALIAATALAALAGPAVAAAAPLDLRLAMRGGSADRPPALEAFLFSPRALSVNGPVRLAAHGAALELQATRRPDGTVLVERASHTPAGITWAPSGLAARSMAHGVRGFLRLRLRRGGRFVVDERLDLCPNTFDAFTASGEPKRRDFPYGCGYVLSRRVPWGIARATAVDAFGHATIALPRSLRPGRYGAVLEVDPDDALGQPDRGDEVRFTLRVRRPPRERLPRRPARRTVAVPAEHDARWAARAARPPAPERPGDPRLPDLVPLPSAAVALVGDELMFDALVANVGPAPLVVRGPLRRGRLATQLFEQDGRVVGRRRVGEFEFDHGDSHQHWHFHDLARYRLRDAAGRVVLRSDKMGFCFMNTHPVDVRYGDPITPATPDQTRGCGLRGRQRIDAGWGDLYSLGFDGQTLDVSGLPNGEYRIEIAVDAGRRLAQTDRGNDVAQRPIRLEGPAGRRRVVVPPIEGVDTAALDDGALMPF